MNNFLEKLAQTIINEGETHKKTVVLPNKRAGVFLHKALAEISKKPLLSPEIISIENFVQQHSPWQNVDWLNLVFIFYESYQDYYANNKQINYIKSFDEFVKWAPIVLKDFDEIDKFLLNPKQVFNYLSEVKILEQWNLENSNSKFINEYKIYFQSLSGLYHELQKKLRQNNLAYTGMMYRYFADNIDEISSKFKQNQLIFAGFNALTKAENNFFKNLSDKNIAKIYWDADKYYMNPVFEAGQFLRDYKNKTDKFNWESDNFHTDKKIDIIKVSGKTPQTQVISQVLKNQLEKNPNQELTKTAIVLTENNLLFPLLDSLPEEPNSINISLGLPITDLPVVQIFTQIANLYFDVEQYGKFKSQNILEILSLPYLSHFFSNNDLIKIQDFRKSIFLFGSKLIPINFVRENSENLPKILHLIFNQKTKLSDLLNLFSNLIKDFLDKDLIKTDKIALLKLQQIFDYIKDFNYKTNIINSLKTFLLIMNRLLSGEQLFFEGEPLEGLQVLGLLETRLLDFENIIMTSVNEGVIPAGKKEQSLIPFDIKIELGLPTYKNQTAIMAYHFYRLLQRAKNITLIYNSDGSGLNNGEQSRFITQIINELPKYHSGIKIEEKQFTPSSTLIDNDTSVRKTDLILNLLDDRAKSGWSPSTLDTYIWNQVLFVKSRLLKLTEEEELIEGIPVNVFGTIVHNTLEDLYTEFKGKFIELKQLETIKKSYKTVAKRYFYKEVNSKFKLTGKKYIAFEIIKKNINDIIDMDIALLKAGKRLKILNLETRLESFVTINSKKIKIKGYVDRIDEVDGQIRIIDYKTGNVESKDLEIKKYNDDLSIIIQNIDYRKIFQVLTYVWLYHKNNPNAKNLTGGIISSRKYHKGIYHIKFNNSLVIDKSIIDEYERVLISLLTDIYDTEKAFEV